MNFLLAHRVGGGLISRKDSIKSSSIMSCDSSSSSSSSSSSGCCSNLSSSSTAQVSGGEEEVSSFTTCSNKSILSPCHSLRIKGGVAVGSSTGDVDTRKGSISTNISSSRRSNSLRFSDHRRYQSPFTDLNSCNHGPSSSVSSNGSISSSNFQGSDIEFGPMGTIKKKSASASTHINGPVLPLTSITRSLAKHSDADSCLVELNDDEVITKSSSGVDYNNGSNVLLFQSNVQYGTLKMRRSFRCKESSNNMFDTSSNHSYSSSGYGGRSFVSNRSSQVTNSSNLSDCSSLASHNYPFNEEDELEFRMRECLNRNSNGSSSSTFNGDHDNCDEEDEDRDLPLPPPPPESESGNLSQSISNLSLISLPPPPPEFSCNTVDTNTLSSVSSSSPSSASSSSSPSSSEVSTTAAHAMETRTRSGCCSGTDPSSDNTLTRTNVRLHQKQQQSSCRTGYTRHPCGQQHHPHHRGDQNQGAVSVGGGNNCCQKMMNRSSLSPSSASSSSFDEDISCEDCSQCSSIRQRQDEEKYQRQQQGLKTGAVNKVYQFPKVNGMSKVSKMCCSRANERGGAPVIGAVGGRCIPVTRSASCHTRDVGGKAKYVQRALSQDDSASHLNNYRSNDHHHQLINGRRYKPMYSSSSSCSSRDGDDQPCSARKCQSPEDVMIQRLESVENVNSTIDTYHDRVDQVSPPQMLHKNMAQVRMSAKIHGLNRSDQPIYDSVFTYRKSQEINLPATIGIRHEEDQATGSADHDDSDDLPLPPPPLELASSENYQVMNHVDNQLISSNPGPINGQVYGVINKANKKNVVDTSLHPPQVRSPMKGSLAPAPEEFVRNLHRVMEKKWKVAQTLSADYSSSCPEEQILTSSFLPQSTSCSNQGINGHVQHPPPPPPSHYQQPNGGHHHQQQGLIDTHIPSPPALTCIQPINQQQQQQKFPPPPPSRTTTDASFYDVLPIHVRPFNRAINQGINYEPSSVPVNGGNSSFGGGHHQKQDLVSSQGINHHWNHQQQERQHPVENVSNSCSSSGLFSRMNPFRRSSKVSSVCSSSSSNYSSGSGSGCPKVGGAAPPPPPKRSDKTKLSNHVRT